MLDFNVLPDVTVRTTDDEIALLTWLREELENLGDEGGVRDCYGLIGNLAGARGTPTTGSRFRILTFDPAKSLEDIWQDLAKPTRGKLEAAKAIAEQFKFYVGYEANAIAALLRSATEEEFSVRTAKLRAPKPSTHQSRGTLCDLIGLAVAHLTARGHTRESAQVAKAHLVRIAGNAAVHSLGVFGSEQLEVLIRSAFLDREPSGSTFWHVLSSEFRS
jgi:hypothetical protein